MGSPFSPHILELACSTAISSALVVCVTRISHSSVLTLLIKGWVAGRLLRHGAHEVRVGDLVVRRSPAHSLDMNGSRASLAAKATRRSRTQERVEAQDAR
jgi:hypothetical protein